MKKCGSSHLFIMLQLLTLLGVGILFTFFSTVSRADLPGLDASLATPPQLAIDEEGFQAESLPTRQRQEAIPDSIPSGTPLWGALAKDFNKPNVEGIGVSSNWSTEQDAAAAAIEFCQQNGGDECHVDLTYNNSCIAIALSDNQVAYWMTDKTSALVVPTAMRHCTEQSGVFCRLMFVDCSYSAP